MTAPAADGTTAMRDVWDTRPGFIGWLGAVNHKQVGFRYIVTAFVFFAIGGIQSLILRAQLVGPDAGVVSPETFNQIMTMHGTTMLFLFAVPVTEAVAMYIAPLQVGTRDMPLPRLNAFGYWVYLAAGIFVYASFIPGTVPDGGWFAYVPFTGPEYNPGLGMDFWLLGVTFIEIAGIIAAIELILLIIKTRAPGMSASRIPLFVWGSLVTGVMVLFAFPPLIAASLMLELDRKFGTAFYDAAAGGDPILWQHLFWWFGHPEVYIMALPAFGIVSMVIPVFARTRIVGYTMVAAATVAIGIVSFGLWAHHMYAAGLPMTAMSFFAVGSFAIAIPSGVQVFAWLATIWKGDPRWATPMLWVVGGLVTFVAGGITGVMVASVPFDWQAHDTYFVVGHFHYVIMGGVVFPLIGGIAFWLPKMTGRQPSELWGKVGFWLAFVGFHVAFFPHHILGLLGMPRRVYTFLPGLGWDIYNLVSTVGAFVTATGVGIALITMLVGGIRGREVGADPWGGGTLEWAATSPPEPYNFRALPIVADREPVWEAAGTIPAPLAALQRRLLDPHRGRREILVSSVLDATPQRIVTLPAHSLRPLFMAAIIIVFLLGVLIDAWPMVYLAGIGIAVGALLMVWRRDDTAPGELQSSFPDLDTEALIEQAGELTPEHDMELVRDLEEDRVDLGSPRPLVWWGTVLALIGLSMGLLTVMFAYAYLGVQADAWPPPDLPDPGVGPYLLGTLLLAGATAVGTVAGHAGRQRRLVAMQGWSAVAAALGLAFLAVMVSDLLAWGLDPTAHAYGSTVVVSLAVHHLAVAGAVLGGIVLATNVGDEPVRKLGAAMSLAPVWWFCGLAWLAVAALVHVGPAIVAGLAA